LIRLWLFPCPFQFLTYSRNTIAIQCKNCGVLKQGNKQTWNTVIVFALQVLEFIFSVAPALSKNSPEDKFNKFVQVLVLSALDEGFRSPVLQSYFSRCIGALLNAIPESQWNENRVSECIY
jgi:hypothetical protein